MVFTSGESYVVNANATLYAQWTPDVLTVNYSVGSGATPQSPATFTYGSAPLTLPTPTLTGYQFTGWFSAGSGGSLVGMGGSGFSPSASTTLYAQWTSDVYVVSYAAEGGTVAEASVDFIVGATPLVLATPTLAGDEFLGWYSAATGGNLIGAGGAIYAPNSSTALYAHWLPVPTSLMSFSANGGSGSVPPVSAPTGTNVTVPGPMGMLRSGFTLARWNTVANGTGTSYLPGQSVVLSHSLVLFAQWTGHAPAVLYGAVGTFSANSPRLTLPLKIEVNRLASIIVAKKYSVVSLYGYTADTGLASLNASLSHARAAVVARYLRARLHTLHFTKVLIKASGEGAVSGKTSANYSRVEVFVS